VGPTIASHRCNSSLLRSQIIARRFTSLVFINHGPGADATHVDSTLRLACIYHHRLYRYYSRIHNASHITRCRLACSAVLRPTRPPTFLRVFDISLQRRRQRRSRIQVSWRVLFRSVALLFFDFMSNETGFFPRKVAGIVLFAKMSCAPSGPTARPSAADHVLRGLLSNRPLLFLSSLAILSHASDIFCEM